MEVLKELIYVVNRNKVKRIDILDLSTAAPTKLNQLYQKISNGEVEDDEAAFQTLYPGADSKSAYYNLKGVLKEKLLNTLFFIDAYQSDHSDRQSAFYLAYKDFAASQLLLAKNARNAGVHLLQKLLKTAEHFEFTDLASSACRLLRLHYGTRHGDERKYRFYQELSEKYERFDQLEGKAEYYYTELVIHYVNNKSTKESLKDLAQKYYNELSELSPEIQTYKFTFHTALIRLFIYTCVNDYPKILPICDEIINSFEQKPYTANTPIQICLHHQLVACLQLRKYDLGKQVAQRSQQLLEEGSFNWFKNLEYFFLLAMHTGNYQKAYEVFHEAVGHRRFDFLPENVTEIWHLYRAYLHLLIDLGKISPDPDDKQFTTFRINRFLNNMPLYSKDKRGMNIAILTVQILFYIGKRKYDNAIDRMEAIEKYCSRYLFKAETMRSYYFIKLLLVIPQACFHRRAVIRYAAPILKKLNGIHGEISLQYHKIEIIPYEVLWEMMLSTLGSTIVDILSVRKTSRRKLS